MTGYPRGASDSDRRIREAVDQYVLTGEIDPIYSAWSGGLLERANRAHHDLRTALLAAVKKLAHGNSHVQMPDVDTVELTRDKVEPMVVGLFPRAERAHVLKALERSIVFITTESIESVLQEVLFDGSAWTLANLYLVGIGADLLSEDAPHLAGVSEETTCCVSPNSFVDRDPFADFIVHEVAHIFHNCKRATIGLPEKRGKEWLLDIDFGSRETFAYACEAYSRILERAKNPGERWILADEYGRAVRISDDRVDSEEVAEILKAAVIVCNGWKSILARYRPKA
jgi:hypothetical protein